MPAAIALGLVLVLVFAFAHRAAAQFSSAQSNVNPLAFGNNFFVTGDYVVGGAYNMNATIVNIAGNTYTIGTIKIPDPNPYLTGTKSVPPGAQIVDALLYWQTVEKSSTVPGGPGSGQTGFFRPVVANGPSAPGYPISGVDLMSQSTVSFSGGGCTGSSGGKVLRTYRADVRALLPQDQAGNVLAGNASAPITYEVRLASNPAATLPTLGATLVLIYRVIDPKVPLNSIVIYDGAFAPGNSLLTMTQTVQGFYQAGNYPGLNSPVSRLTHIVGNGHNYKFQTVSLNNKVLPPLYPTGQPFPGYYGTWDNTTWTFPAPGLANPIKGADAFGNEGAASATTMVVPSGSQQGCVSWGAVIVSTTVQNSDNDGLLDVWKTKQGYCDVAVNPGTCNGPTDPSWVSLADPNDPPKLGQKDVFVQLDYMCSNVTGPISCTPGNNTPNGPYSFDPRLPVDPVDGKSAVQKVIDAFAGVGTSTNHTAVTLHVIPTHAIKEPTCTDVNTTLAGLCAFPNQPGVVGWKGGLVFVKNQLVDPSTGKLYTTTTCPAGANCVSIFQHGKKDSYHYALFAHALGLANWSLQAGTLANVDPNSSGPNVMQTGFTVTFKTSTPHGLAPYGAADLCPSGRVTVAFAASNPNLNGTHCVHVVDPSTFTIQVANSTNATYTLSTDPNLAVASGQAGTVSGFSDVGGQDSLITLGLWGNPALSTSDGQNVTFKAGTFMHELGHSLGLTHGGFYYNNLAQNPQDYTPTVELNCKTNFQSVMSYMYQVDLLNKGGLTNVPDYSGQTLVNVDKTVPNLNPFGVAMNNPYGVIPYQTSWHGTKVELETELGPHVVDNASPLKSYCDGSPLPLPPNTPSVFRVTRVGNLLQWAGGQDINFDGTTVHPFRGHNDWVPIFDTVTGTLISPGVDPRQVGMTGSLSALVGGGLQGGSGGLQGGSGGLQGGSGGLQGGSGGLQGGSGGLQGGSGGLQGGSGGVPELTQAVANSFTRPPRNLIVTAEDASPRLIHLMWAAPTFGQIGAYRIYRSSDGGRTFALVPNGQNGAVPGTQLFYTDTVTCNPTGYKYYVAAVLAGTFAMFPPGPTEGQESVPSNTVPAPTQGLLTGCYTNAPSSVNLSFSSPTAGASAIQGDPVAISWTVQDDWTVQNDVYTVGGSVPASANTQLVAIGPIPHDGACSTLATPPVFLNHTGLYPFPVSILSSSGSGLTFNNNQFTFTWNTLPLVMGAGCYFFELDLDSGQHETTSAFTLLILVSGPTITTTTLPPVTVGSPYSSTLTERGGVAGFTWTLDSGSLPTGISLDKATGALSGTPCATPGSYNFTARVTDTNLDFGTRALTLNVLAAPVAQVNQPLAPEGSVPAAASGFTLTVNGTGFVPSCSAVLWNGSPRTTTFKSATQLTASILAADVATFGTPSISVATTGSPTSNVDFYQITNPTNAVSLSGTTITPGLSPSGLISADFNGDGKPDLAIVNTLDSTVSILLGNGDGTFTAKPNLALATGSATGGGPFSLIAGDFNNDGRLDLAVTNFANGTGTTVSVFIGNGGGTFQPAATYTVGSGPVSVVTGDFNGDGKLDLAVANKNDHTISILLDNGDGTFQPHGNYAAGTLDVAGLAVADLNGDGKLDLAVTNPGTDQVSVLFGNGDGTFSPPATYLTGVAGSHPVAVSAADFNGDGILDLAVTNLSGNNVAILLGNTDGTFKPQVSYSTTGGNNTGPTAITTGDFNGDGKLDLAVTNQGNNSVSILLGNGDGTFQNPLNPLEFTTGSSPAGVAAGDFNGDGRLDLAVANFGSSTVSIMLQPQVLLVPSALAFGSVAEGASTPSAVSLTNNGPGALTISNFAFGGTNPGDFTQTNNCPASSSTLAAGLSCTITITFAPTATSARSGTLIVTYPGTGSPQTVNLSGSGFVAAPANLTANAVAGSGSVSLAWSASPSASGGYNVYRSTTSGAYTSANKIASGVATTSYTDTVATGTTYYYVVTAVDGSVNESAFSNEAFATP
jgi:hypothetical protein